MEARVAELEGQLLEAEAQAKAAAINSEHAGQAMERRYTALAEEQGKVAAEREKLLAENAKLVEDLRAAKADNNRLQAVVFEKDAFIQRKDVEIEALHSDKRTLAKLLEQREAELNDAHSRHRQSLDKIVVLSNTNASLDAEAHEARAAKNRLQQDVLKMEQHVENLEGHTKWLEAEVAAKIEAAQQERRTVSTQVVQLQQTIAEAEDKVQQLERSERRLKERVAELQRSAETAQQNLKVARDEGDSKEHIFNKELATAQKLYTLYKDASEERSRKVIELEGIIRELQKHLEEAEAAQRDVLERAEARVVAAEQEAATEREQRCRVMEAAANGNLPLVSSPGNAPVSLNGETFSHTELYMKYVEATTQCRHERLAKRQIEIMLEQVMGEIEAKSETSSAVITSDDVISERLLSFQDIQSLQQKNMELLTVELFEQIVRQREMFKKLFQDASSSHGTPDGSRLLLPAPGAAAPDSNGHAQRDEPDYKAMHRDLEKELEHVRKEGEEHIRLLNQESAKVKEAASAARAEAARMRNEADFERERGQRLQEQLRDLHQQVEALTQSNTKYQVLVIELQQRLSNLDTELGTQRDKARQMEARANFLENEKALLTAAEQRLGSADKEAEYVAERGRLTTEVARLDSALALAQSSRVDEQRHLKTAAQDSQAAAERAENKAKVAEEATQQLRNEAAQSAQRAISAEVKVEVLQKAVQQAEERVATLEMQMQSRSGMLENNSEGGGSQAPAGSREADLANQIKHLQYEERIKAIRKEAEDLQGQVAALERGRTEAQQHLHAAEKAVEDANRQAATREAELKAQLADKDKDKQQLGTRLRRQDEDIKQLRSQCRSVQTSYDRQVVEHAAAVNKLNALDVAYKSASDRLRQQEDAVAQAQREKANAETELNRQRLLLEQKVQEAEAKVRDVEEQNRLVHVELSKMAEQRASTEGEADGGLAQVVTYLRRQEEILSALLDKEKQANARLQSESLTARRMADAAEAQMASQAERARQSARTEEDHAALMHKVEQLNWLRDSNEKLRGDNDRTRQEVAKLRQRADKAEEAAEPLRKRIHELSAQVESHGEEMREVREELKKLQAENADLKKQLTEAQKELSAKMKEVEDAKSDLKNREGRQQHEKQLSINAVQAERRRQADEKAGLQKALDAAKSSAAASSGAPTLQDQLRAKLLANRGLSPVPEPIKPSEGSGDDDRKREAEVVEQPVAKRARTTSESNTAAQSQAESFLASLEESSAAAATLAEDADVDVEAYVEEQGDEEQQEEEYEGEYEEEGEGDGDGEAEVEAEDHSGEGEDAEQSALEQQQDEAAQDAEDMMEDDAEAAPVDGQHADADMKREKAPIEWKAQASAAKAGPAAPSLSPAAVPYIPKPGRGATSGRAFPPGRGGPGRLPHVATPGPLAGRGLQSLSGNLQQRGGRARGHARGSRGRRQPGAPEGQPPAEGQQ
ncbi:hypothetical protein WJX75_009773 [Coccomyxa subellipsoidea]|uniref:Nucleoprotein TPR/MLP1 domain-containing protein n=1 Tax=Coccomyxa subellipsoidea TaxID=248742 RepID=A0ABR2Z002_9CHLO